MNSTILKVILTSITTLSLTATVVGFFMIKDSQPAFAAKREDWIAGNIISDSSFTDNSSMSVDDIQSFLDRNIGNCDVQGSGRAVEFGYNGTRAQYAASRGWQAPPYTCLNKYYEVPKTTAGGSMPANNYSNPAVRPAGSQSAAWIIKNAADRYSISPKVLLVKIATESSGPLTSDAWPLFSQYRYAMGSHCPDSGPGGSANCDPAYSGFSIQMYSAAELMRWYLDSMNEPWWSYKKPGNNQILWNVEPRGCGSSNVNIQNKATAALYTYTPYQPNNAALNNMYGTGDNCSAYGNRNFWRVYWDWFGDTRNSQPYKLSLRSISVYSDAARTQQINVDKSLNLQPNQLAYATITVDNTGGSSWNNSTILETTNTPVLTDSSWIARNKASRAKEGAISTGQTATYEFTLKAPATPQIYTQRFDLHHNDSNTWFGSPDISLRVTTVTRATNPGVSDANRLKTGEVMRDGDIKYSPEKHTALRLLNGNLQLFANFKEVWSSRTTGDDKSRLVNQTDGNLVLYNKDNKALWASDTQPEKSTLTVQTDSNMVHRTTTGNQPVWASNTNLGDQLAKVNTTLKPGSTVFPMQSLTTVDRRSKLVLQTDGNLVLYSKSGRAVWASNTDGNNGSSLTLQEDLNLVLYSSDRKALWATNTVGAK